MQMLIYIHIQESLYGNIYPVQRSRTFTYTAQHTWRAGATHRPARLALLFARDQRASSLATHAHRQEQPEPGALKLAAPAQTSQDRPHGPGRVNNSRLHLCNSTSPTHPPPSSPPRPLSLTSAHPSTSHRQLANMREVISLNGMSLFTPLCYGPRALTASPVSPGKV
jgi:hypothetical protein